MNPAYFASMAQECRQCPRRCGADRTAGTGYCGMPAAPVLARASLHQWEEPCIAGKGGAGTIFFSGCSLGCVFCQNDSISRQCFGQEITPERLREIFGELIAAGAETIDLVNPTHYAHVLAPLLAQEKPPVPVVWNSGGYDSIDTLQALEGCVDVYLPDYKYPDSETAARYAGAEDYPAAAQAAIREMVRQTGPYRIGENGILTRGVLIRHLILPGRVKQAKEIMDWAASEFPPHTVLFSLMSQYTPLGRAGEYPELNRRLRRSEARNAADYMHALGLDGYTQEDTSASAEYVPAFDLSGVLRPAD